MIDLMYIQPSKQSEIDEVFQNGIFQYIGLMIGLMCIQLLYAESCHETSISFLFNVPFTKCHILIVVLVTKSNISLDELRL